MGISSEYISDALRSSLFTQSLTPYFHGSPYNTDLGADLLIPMAPFWNHHAPLFSEIICNDSTLKEAQTNCASRKLEPIDIWPN